MEGRVFAQRAQLPRKKFLKLVYPHFKRYVATALAAEGHDKEKDCYTKGTLQSAGSQEKKSVIFPLIVYDQARLAKVCQLVQPTNYSYTYIYICFLIGYHQYVILGRECLIMKQSSCHTWVT